MRPVFFIQVFFPGVFRVQRRVFPSRANTSACALASLQARVFLYGVSTFRALSFFLFFFSFFVEDFSACASSVRFAAKCVAGAGSSCQPLSIAVSSSEVSRIQVVAPCIRGILASGDPFTSATLDWVLSRCRPIETFISASLWSRPAVNFMHGVGRFTSFGHSCFRFLSELPAHTVKYRHFRGPRPMPRLVHR